MSRLIPAVAYVLVLFVASARGDELTDRGFDPRRPESKKVLDYTKKHGAHVEGRPDKVDPRNPYGQIVNACARESFLLTDPEALELLDRCIELRTKEYERRQARAHGKKIVAPPPKGTSPAEDVAPPESEGSRGEAMMEGAPPATR